MKGVMLVNMGGPDSPEELRIFLSRMFNDPCILPYGKPVRKLLSYIISCARYRQSWKKYQLIGGTPLVESTRKMASVLQTSLGNTFVVKFAFSYSPPDIKQTLYAFRKEGISEITVIPLYPQSSYTTTASVQFDIKKETDGNTFFKIAVQGEFYNHPGFISFWVHNITKHLEKNGIKNATLLFSAHSIPEYHVLNGDTYLAGIVNSAALIAVKLGYPYEVAFQSGMRRGKWIGPDVKVHLKKMAEDGLDNLLLIPISFVHENLETLYDLDQDIIPFAINALGFSNVSRVHLPDSDPLLVSMLADLILKT